ncbi:ATP-binding protein [Reichenbachiella sp.]|uniref:ATP-binding protein n=1 Tax=Reichenbachiella sp. TaxID=2184521 RepID=UPI003BB056BB
METRNALHTLHQEVNWLTHVINQVIISYLKQEGHENNWMDIPMPDLTDDPSPYASKVKEWELGLFERLALALTIAPHLRPESLDIFFGKNQMYDRGFTEFGGVVNDAHNGFLPTGQTFNFLASANDANLRTEVARVLHKEHPLMKEQVLHLGSTEGFIPSLNGVLSMDEKWIHFFLTGEQLSQEHSASFPAQRITTKLAWEDIVLDESVMNQVMEINAWLKHGDTLLNEWNLDQKIKPGYRALFYGPPGTGKTLTATLLGKASGREVYKIDLSMIVSKYIGETEKNLSKIFDIAEHKNWILFFDEADALYGKRTAANNSNDRHANQQTAYLLQRIEDFPGVVILASNLRGNMDEAFSRRFQSMVRFKVPSVEERFQLWQNAFSGKCTLDPDIDVWKVAEEFEITGGAIINVLRFCALAAIDRGDTVVQHHELMSAIRKEFGKENKTLSMTQGVKQP